MKSINKRLLSVVLTLAMVAALFTGFGGAATAVEDSVTVTVSLVIYGEEFFFYSATLSDGSTMYDLVNEVFDDLEPTWVTVPDFQYENVTYEALESLYGLGTVFVDYVYEDGSWYYIYDGWIFTVNEIRPSEMRPGVAFPVQLYMDQVELQDGDEIVLNYDTWYEEM
ncbi:MAG: hypothetical protein LBH17_06065 [Oscillospiraceae bacterium]|jgi:hypothetical protein|nr:hypothetical protein [Oscillospiraceae bacterium]